MQFNVNNLEETVFDMMDQFKILFSEELWENILLNCTKNEMFVLMWLYRNEEVNMSSIADYLNVPLNTATGIVSRMEKKGMVKRVRSQADKRVVTIEMTDQGLTQIDLIMKEYLKYGQRILKDLSLEEMQLLNKLMSKVVDLLQHTGQEENEPQKQIRKIQIN